MKTQRLNKTAPTEMGLLPTKWGTHTTGTDNCGTDNCGTDNCGTDNNISKTMQKNDNNQEKQKNDHTNPTP